MELLVGGGQHLALVDHIHAKGLEDLGFYEVADTYLAHHRDGDRIHDLHDDCRVCHPGHSPGLPDVRGNPLQGHDCDGPGLLGDFRLLRVDHIHDHAPFLHGRKSPLQELGAKSQFLEFHMLI
ncbi:MAG: hypothetical protein A4E36_01718 [Methanoregulaceae archaeon PtaB.Bin009]|nr:MAG: hypothetical protein A4E36_01718 [Methanoregulaceae archaeon PtaB.Bin009]